MEPMPRGTASVVGLAAVAIHARDPESVMAVVTADHFIGDTERFNKLLVAAKRVALDGYLVTLGITPTFPSTGYGYIQRGKSIGIYDGLNAYEVKKFSIGMIGRCSCNICACSDTVTTRIRSGGKTAPNRSTACWYKLVSPTSFNICFGLDFRESGHIRVPPPPAIITA